MAALRTISRPKILTDFLNAFFRQSKFIKVKFKLLKLLSAIILALNTVVQAAVATICVVRLTNQTMQRLRNQTMQRLRNITLNVPLAFNFVPNSTH